MKTFKFFSALLMLMTFFALTSYSQGNVKTTSYVNSGELTNFTLPGVSETVTGSYSGYWTVWFFKSQWRAKGTYVGDDSGTIYYTSAVENYIFKDWMPGLQVTNTSKMHIRDESGTFHYTYHYTGHATINANGEITNNFDKIH